MDKKIIIKQVTALVAPLLEPKMELVDVEWINEYDAWYLKIFLAQEGNISLDDCQRMSKKINSELDAVTALEEAYFLEVSSPGLDRPFKTERDYERAIGKGVEATFYKKVDGLKIHLGILESLAPEFIVLRNDKDETKTFERKLIAKIHYRIEF